MKKLLIVEVVVGVLIVIGGIYILASGSDFKFWWRDKPVPSPTESTYISSPLQISLKYPSNWKIDPTYSGIPGIERFRGTDGFFVIGASIDPIPNTKSRKVIKYPKPIKLGETTYKYFVLEADAVHLQLIGNSVQFLNKP